MDYIYKPKGVCSKEMQFSVEEGIVTDLKVLGGCDGSLAGISKLVKGMPVQQVIERLSGTDCGGRGTSCPDQLAKALEEVS